MNLKIDVPTDADELRRMRRWLNILAWVAVLDFILLIPLLYSASFFADHHGVVQVLGPIHGFGFLVMLAICIRGVGERWWGWWFPAIIVITLGPLGSLIGDWLVRKRIPG
jgi:hypothetical protein